jgi:hypothetical protein
MNIIWDIKYKSRLLSFAKTLWQFSKNIFWWAWPKLFKIDRRDCLNSNLDDRSQKKICDHNKVFANDNKSCLQRCFGQMHPNDGLGPEVYLGEVDRCEGAWPLGDIVIVITSIYHRRKPTQFGTSLAAMLLTQTPRWPWLRDARIIHTLLIGTRLGIFQARKRHIEWWRLTMGVTYLCRPRLSPALLFRWLDIRIFISAIRTGVDAILAR